eukprot:gb/GECG01011169.1/.p1 GENE.gb/GECG01011169.1/~~gb/GECG01011169.1/.p1  ORF type:complete len:293 (+),score=40.87 gb/GECG01011169.1/:1-879(+)
MASLPSNTHGGEEGGGGAASSSGTTTTTASSEAIKSAIQQMADVYDFTRTSEQEILTGLQQKLGTQLDASSIRTAKRHIASVARTQEAMNPPTLHSAQHPQNASQSAATFSRYTSTQTDQLGGTGAQYPFDVLGAPFANEQDFTHPYFANFGQLNADSLEPIVELPPPLQAYFERSSMPLNQVVDGIVRYIDEHALPCSRDEVQLDSFLASCLQRSSLRLRDISLVVYDALVGIQIRPPFDQMPSSHSDSFFESSALGAQATPYADEPSASALATKTKQKKQTLGNYKIKVG